MKTLYFFFQNTGDSQISIPFEMDYMKSKFVVKEARRFGDFDVFFQDAKVGHLFSNLDQFNEHCKQNGF